MKDMEDQSRSSNLYLSGYPERESRMNVEEGTKEVRGQKVPKLWRIRNLCNKSLVSIKQHESKKKTPTNTESYSEQNQIIPNMQKLRKFTLYSPYLRKLLEDILQHPKERIY